MRTQSFAPVMMACAIGMASETVAIAQTGFSAITDEAEFTAVIVNKEMEMVSDQHDSTVILQSDGRVVGQFNGTEMTGDWRWENGRYCREVTLGDRTFPDQCQTVEVDGNLVRFIRPDGSISPVYRLP